MHPNEELLEAFYKAFQKRDYKAMAECYHPQATFSDPIFRGLDNRGVTGMWKMLLTRAKDLEATYSNVKANNETGNADWEAKYTYSATGSKVINRVKSSFRFKDGKIIEQNDNFNLSKWAGMALGVKGKLLGWLPPVQNSISKRAMSTLEQYLKENK